MKRLLTIWCAAVLVSAMPAFADTAGIVKAHSEAFSKAMDSCDIPAVMSLYEDDATLIWPGEGEVASDKAGMAKIVEDTCASPQKPTLKPVSSHARSIGQDYIVNVGMWDASIPGPNGKSTISRIRTTEVLHKSGGKWRYVVDHASIGLPPPPPAKP